MQVNPKLIKKQFEKSLETYNKSAVVQKIMAEKLVTNLSKIKSDFDNILETGCGAGLLTSELVKKIKFKNYYANDLVEKSENYIKNIIPDAKFYCGNALNIKPSRKMDLIISNAMFQWFQNLEKVSDIYSLMLEKDGILAFSTFSPENYKEIKELTGLSLNYKTLDEIKEVFGRNFEIIDSEEFVHTLKFSSPLELLAHMKNTGVNSLTAKHWTFKEVKAFCDDYREKYPENTLTYAGIIVVAARLN